MIEPLAEFGAPSALCSENPNSRLGRKASPYSQARVMEASPASVFVGIDVSKDRLDVHLRPTGESFAIRRDGAGLEQLMAFTVNGDHARQEQVFETLAQSYSKEPYAIRRMLTEGSVRASDKRAQFIGIDVYVKAGGTVLNDLFQSDDGGWLKDVALVDRLVAEKLDREAEAIRSEGWKWIEVAPDFPSGHAYGLRQLRGEEVPLTGDETAARDALRAEYDKPEETWAEADELPDEVDQRHSEIETALESLRGTSDQVRSGRDCARRRLRQHRRCGPSAGRARLCPPRGRAVGRDRAGGRCRA